MTKRASTHRDGRALSQNEAIPQEDFEEITDRIDLLTSRPPKPEVKMSNDDLGKLLASFEADLCRLNGSLTKEARANRSTLKDFSTEAEKTKKSVDELNLELNVVVRREVG